MTLGHSWKSALEPLGEEQIHNRLILLNGRKSNERRAARLLSKIKKKTLYEGINSCIDRTSDSLGIPVPPFIASTDAFMEFKLWATDQGLVVDLAFLPDGECLLLATPI